MTQLETSLAASVDMIDKSRAGTPVNNQLARVESVPLDFSKEQQALLRDSFANGASESEFRVLLEVAKARRLNPFTRQIHFVKRWDGEKRREVWSCQVGIDGFRAIAQRTGLYDGQDEPVFEYGGDKLPIKCTVSVYRKDWRRPSVGVAYFSEYAQTKREGGLTRMWAEKPHIMISKCAEALALRKAFPEDLSGLYAPEEMGMEPAPVEERPRQPTISPHFIEGDDPDRPPDEVGTDVFSGLEQRLIELEEAIAKAQAKDLRALRLTLGSKANPRCELLDAINAASGRTGSAQPQINQAQRKALSKIWARCDRQLAKKEAEPPVPGDVLDSFTDEEE